jgi:hypothetical protein
MQVELLKVMRTVETLQGMALGQDLRNSIVLYQQNFSFSRRRMSYTTSPQTRPR